MSGGRTRHWQPATRHCQLLQEMDDGLHVGFLSFEENFVDAGCFGLMLVEHVEAFFDLLLQCGS